MRYFVRLQDSIPLDGPFPEDVMKDRFREFDPKEPSSDFVEFVLPDPDADLTGCEIVLDGGKAVLKVVNG